MDLETLNKPVTPLEVARLLKAANADDFNWTEDGRNIIRRMSFQLDKTESGCSTADDLVTVLRNVPEFSHATLCRLMDDCLPEQIENETDMQKFINKLWPALVCELISVSPRRTQ